MNEAKTSTGIANGPGSAALVAAGLGSITLAVLAIVADHSAPFKQRMIFYKPTGPLSGVTSLALVVWIVSWVALDMLWRRREMKGWVMLGGLGLIVLSFVLTFPPVVDLF